MMVMSLLSGITGLKWTDFTSALAKARGTGALKALEIEVRVRFWPADTFETCPSEVLSECSIPDLLK